MLNRNVSDEYMYLAYCVICAALGYMVFGPYGAFVAVVIGMLYAIAKLIDQIRRL